MKRPTRNLLIAAVLLTSGLGAWTFTSHSPQALNLRWLLHDPQMIPSSDAPLAEVLLGGANPYEWPASSDPPDMITIAGQQFHPQPCLLTPEVISMMQALTQHGTYGLFTGEKKCGGFHADFQATFAAGYRVQVCLTCGEAMIDHNGTVWRCELDHEIRNRLKGQKSLLTLP